MGPILVATDLSPRSEVALHRAAQLAKAHGAPLHVVHILDEDLPAAVLSLQAEAIEQSLIETIATSPWSDGVSPRVDVEVGHLATMLPNLVQERQADLLVLGSHRGRGLAELVGAPTLARLLAGVEVPILVAVSSEVTPWQRGIVGWDFSPAAEAAAQLAKTVAPGVALSLFHVWTDPAQASPYAFDMGGPTTAHHQGNLEAALAEAWTKLDLGSAPDGIPHTALVGPPAAMLVREAKQHGADVLVLGRHARSGIARFFLGDTAARAALHAACDVLIAPPAGQGDR